MEKYKIDRSWYPLFQKWFPHLEAILEDVYNPANKIPTFPEREQVFKVFELPINQIKCVLLGQAKTLFLA